MSDARQLAARVRRALGLDALGSRREHEPARERAPRPARRGREPAPARPRQAGPPRARIDALRHAIDELTRRTALGGDQPSPAAAPPQPAAATHPLARALRSAIVDLQTTPQAAPPPGSFAAAVVAARASRALSGAAERAAASASFAAFSAAASRHAPDVPDGPQGQHGQDGPDVDAAGARPPAPQRTASGVASARAAGALDLPAGLPVYPMLAPLDDDGTRYAERFEPGTALPGRPGSDPVELEPLGASALSAVRALRAINRSWRRGLGDDPTRAGRTDATPLAPGDVVFLDTETTGLSRAAGTLAFLIGVGHFEPDGALRVEQLLLGDPGDEARALERLAHHLGRARVVVTYNGRGFDMPLLATRACICRQRLPLAFEHIDLLPYCRRLFVARTSDRRLKTIEREVLGFDRGPDIDGALAPRIYAAYLARRACPDALARTAEAVMGAVMRHNRVDIASLAPLLLRVARAVHDPGCWAEDGEEVCAVARLHEDFGAAATAERAYERALELSGVVATRRTCLESLARLRRRAGDRAGARAVWKRFRDEFPALNAGWVELAKHSEHHGKDLDAALALARAAPARDGAVAHRIARLERRIARREAPQERG